eukprot:gene18719-24481_t
MESDSVISHDEEHMKAMWAGQSNVVVAVRVRPLLKHDQIKKSCVRVLDGKVVVILDPSADKSDILRANRSKEKQYAFDYAFDPNMTTQEDVYNRTTKFLIHGVLDGFNATVFAYGQTGSGKTHTMIGNPSDPGIMVRVMEDLFTYSQSSGVQQRVNYKVTVSFLEVYNENIRDLLSETEEYLDLREDPIKGPVVAGITEVETKSSNDIMSLLHQGNSRRSQASTAANETSSRSHAVLQVVVENVDKAPGVVANIKVGKLSLVDLAGSERAANTKNVGARLVEGANINRSLLALGNCINALGEKGNKGNFVPYRDSKLTRLLKDSLGGNCRTVMIANISSAESSFEETLNTLKYANRAKNIKTNIQRNVLNVNYHISEYVQLITNLRGEIKNLKDQLNSNLDSQVNINDRELGIPLPKIQSPNGSSPVKDGDNSSLTSFVAAMERQHKHPSTPLEILRESMKSVGEGRGLLNQMREKIVENFQEKMQLRRSLIELEDQNVQNSIEVSKRQLLIVQWSESQGNSPTKIKNQLTQNMAEFTEDILENAPFNIQTAWQENEQLRKAILKNNAMKKSIAKRLRHNEKEAEKLRDEMTNKVTGEDRRELMELQYQVGRLELENMELEQHRIVHESILKGKDLTIQKLQLQLAVRDKVIQRQQNVLKENDLDQQVGYTQLALLEQTLMSDVDLSTTLVPPSPPRSISEMALNISNNIGLTPSISSGNTINKNKMKVPKIPRMDDADDKKFGMYGIAFRELDNNSKPNDKIVDKQPIDKSDWAEIPSDSDDTVDNKSTSPRYNKMHINGNKIKYRKRKVRSIPNPSNVTASTSNNSNNTNTGIANNPNGNLIISETSLGVQGNGFAYKDIIQSRIHPSNANGGVRINRFYKQAFDNNDNKEQSNKPLFEGKGYGYANKKNNYLSNEKLEPISKSNSDINIDGNTDSGNFEDETAIPSSRSERSTYNKPNAKPVIHNHKWEDSADQQGNEDQNESNHKYQLSTIQESINGKAQPILGINNRKNKVDLSILPNSIPHNVPNSIPLTTSAANTNIHSNAIASSGFDRQMQLRNRPTKSLLKISNSTGSSNSNSNGSSHGSSQ